MSVRESGDCSDLNKSGIRSSNAANDMDFRLILCICDTGACNDDSIIDFPITHITSYFKRSSFSINCLSQCRPGVHYWSAMHFERTSTDCDNLVAEEWHDRVILRASQDYEHRGEAWILFCTDFHVTTLIDEDVVGRKCD